MPSIEAAGPFTSVVATSCLANFIFSIILQVYAARHVQSKSGGLSGPI
jgi:hypothetical protein